MSAIALLVIGITMSESPRCIFGIIAPTAANSSARARAVTLALGSTRTTVKDGTRREQPVIPIKAISTPTEAKALSRRMEFIRPPSREASRRTPARLVRHRCQVQRTEYSHDAGSAPDWDGP